MEKSDSGSPDMGQVNGSPEQEFESADNGGLEVLSVFGAKHWTVRSLMEDLAEHDEIAVNYPMTARLLEHLGETLADHLDGIDLAALAGKPVNRLDGELVLAVSHAVREVIGEFSESEVDEAEIEPENEDALPSED